MKESFFQKPDIKQVLSDKDLSQFGDCVVNFIYNVAICRATQKLQGVKVWDYSLAKACKNSPLRSYVGSRKNAGELGDAVEAFIGYLYIKRKSELEYFIDVLTRYIEHDWDKKKISPKELCAAAFTHLLNKIWEDVNF